MRWVSVGAAMARSRKGTARRRSEPWLAGAEWLRARRQRAGFLAVIGGLLAYILISDWLGFVPTALALLFGWLVLFRNGRPVSSLVIALAVTLVVQFAFSQILLVPLPLGVLQSLIY